MAVKWTQMEDDGEFEIQLYICSHNEAPSGLIKCGGCEAKQNIKASDCEYKDIPLSIKLIKLITIYTVCTVNVS